MTKVFELWDASTNNLVAAYDREADALAFVRAYVVEHGSTYPQSWVLLWDDDAADDAEQIAEGSALIARASATAAKTEESDTPSRRLAG